MSNMAAFETVCATYLRLIGEAYRKVYPQGSNLNLSVNIDRDINRLCFWNTFWGRDSAHALNVNEAFDQRVEEKAP